MPNTYVLSFILGIVHMIAFNAFGLPYIIVGVALTILDWKRVTYSIQQEQLHLAAFVNIFTKY